MVTGVGSPQAGANMSAAEKKPPADNRRVSHDRDYIVLLFVWIKKGNFLPNCAVYKFH